MIRRQALLLATALPVAALVPLNSRVLAADGMIPDVPTITVKELADRLRKEGFQHRYLAHQIRFRCTAIPAGGKLDKPGEFYFEIKGLEETPMSKTRLYSSRIDFKKGMQLDVHGLIVEQNYGVWSVWVYSASEVS